MADGSTVPGHVEVRPKTRILLSLPISTSSNAILFIVCVLVSLVLQLPGNVPFDGITVWYEAVHGILFKQHPPAMVLLWRISNLAAPGPAPFTGLQLLTLWLFCAVAVERWRPPLWLAAAFYLAMLASPLVFAMSGKIGKDIIGGHLAILAFVVAARADGPPRSNWEWAIAWACATLAAMIRYQLGVIFLALGVLLLLERRQFPGLLRNRVWASFGSVVLTFAVVTVGIAAIFISRGPNDVDQSFRKIFLFDIAGAQAYDHEARLPVFSQAGVDQADIKAAMIKLYDPARVDTLWVSGGVFDKLQNLSDAAIFRQWRYTLLHEPKAFFFHRMAAFRKVLGFGDIYTCWPVYAGISKIPTDRVKDLNAQSYGRAISADIVKARYFPAGTFLFRAWTYSLVCLVLLTLPLFWKEAPPEAAALGAVGVLYELSFFVLPQACDVRYSYLTMLSAMLSGAIAIFSVTRQRPGPTAP